MMKNGKMETSQNSFLDYYGIKHPCIKSQQIKT